MCLFGHKLTQYGATGLPLAIVYILLSSNIGTNFGGVQKGPKISSDDHITKAVSRV